MHNNDAILTRDAIRQRLMNANQATDNEAYVEAQTELLWQILTDTQRAQEDAMQGYAMNYDTQVMRSRGVRQLTREENTFYQKVLECMGSNNPRQAIENLELVMPKTVIDSVFEDLSTRHPLLNVIDFRATAGLTQDIMNKNGYQEAAWGDLCDEVVKEVSASFEVIDATLKKLSAFIPVCKAMLDLGPVWLDRFVREVLYESLANGLETGIIKGDGNKAPIGMMRQIGEGVSVVDGAYPEKEAIAITEITPLSIGTVIGGLLESPSGVIRDLRNLILLVNPKDYYTKFGPATTMLNPAGSGWVNDIMPYPTTVIRSCAVPLGKAILGDAKMYHASAGMSKAGRIEYSDHQQFLQDKRLYMIKTYANGRPKDANSFAVLDISNLQPLAWMVKMVDATAAATAATVSDET